MTRNVARAGLVLLALAATILIGPGLHAAGTLTEISPLELGEGAAPVDVKTRGPVAEDIDGYRVQPGGEAVVTVPLTLPQPYDGRTLLRVWAYGPEGVRTTAALRAADGSERHLGRASTWGGKLFDVTEEARRGAAWIRVRAENPTADDVLFLDRLAPVAVAGSLEPEASALSVGLLVLLLTSLLLELAGRLRRHWPLSLLLALAAVVLWSNVSDTGTTPLEATSAATWAAATSASWFGFHDGLLSGSWQSLSSLAVQVFHALTPIVGTAPASARSAAALSGVVAFAAVYALAYRAAGRLGAVAAVLLGLTAVEMHDAVAAGSALPVLVLAGALFAYALHACLAQATPLAIGILGAAVALVMLSDPAWLPGAVVAVVVVAVVCADPTQRVRVVRVGLLAALVFALPHLVSTASQNDGNLFANQKARATAARNIEFVGRGHGAPSPQQYARDPLSGEPVTLTGYLLGDHTVAELVGGALAGGQDSIGAFVRSDGPVLGTFAVILSLAAALFVLLLQRLRLLVLLAPVVAAPALFIAAQAGTDPAAAGAVLWPVMLTSVAILVHAAARLSAPLLQPYVARIDALGTRLHALRRPARGASAAPRRRRA
jgi:hypothetical protein